MGWPKGVPRKAVQTEEQTMSETGAVPAAPALSGEQFEQLLNALMARGGGGLTREEFRSVLEEQRKVTNPSNPDHPGISVFSHPEGDRAKPKPPLPYTLLWNGYPVNKFPETETWAEWTAQAGLAPLVPGEYLVLRNDGSKMKVTVTGERDADGNVTKVTVTHPNQREDKDKVPPKTAIIYQMQHQDNLKQAFAESMRDHLMQMMGVRL